MDGRTSEYGLTKSVSSACNDTFNDYNDRLSLQRGEVLSKSERRRNNRSTCWHSDRWITDATSDFTIDCQKQ